MKNSIRGIWATLGLACLSSVGCAIGIVAPVVESTETPNPTPPSLPTAVVLSELLRDGSLGYSIAYADGWSVSGERAARSISHPLGSLVALGSLEKTSRITLEEFAATSVDDVVRKGRGTGYAEVSRTHPIEGQSFLVEARWTASTGPDIGLEMSAKFLATEGKDRFFVAVSLVRESLREFHQPVLDAMLGSFTTFSPDPTPAPPYPSASPHANGTGHTGTHGYSRARGYTGA